MKQAACKLQPQPAKIPDMVLARKCWNADPLKLSVFASVTRFTLLAARSFGEERKCAVAEGEKTKHDLTYPNAKFEMLFLGWHCELDLVPCTWLDAVVDAVGSTLKPGNRSVGSTRVSLTAIAVIH